MSRAEAKKLLVSIGIEEPTDEQITNYLNSVGGEIQKEKDKAKTESAEIERLKAIEKEFEESKTASLTAEEKYQKAIKDMTEQSKKSSRELNKMKAENIFATAGLKAEDYASILDGFVRDTSEETVSLATGFTAILKSQIEATEKKVKADLLNGTPAPQGGNGTPATVTKEQFKEMTYQQMADLKTGNPTLFTQLNS